MLNFNTPIQFLKGVGQSRANSLIKEKNISTLEDLLYYFPSKYIDRSKFTLCSEIASEELNVQLKGKIHSFKLEGRAPKERMTAIFSDESGSIQLIWFKSLQFIRKSIENGKEYVIFGKPNLYQGRYTIAHPEIDDPNKAQAGAFSQLFAQYPQTEGLKNAKITSRSLRQILSDFWRTVTGPFEETLPNYIINQYKLMPLTRALYYTHFPKNIEVLKQARARLKFEELFYIQLHIIQNKNYKQSISQGMIFDVVGDNFNNFYKNHLPFELTGAQKRVLKEIRADFKSGKQSNRLVQGDVGSGKTLVALLSMLIAIDNGYQACIMAPTEILANQHFQTISNFLKDMDIKVELLTGSVKTKQRRSIHQSLEDGSLNILVGTHALIEDDVIFRNLGLAVIDEQHRFGVEQRAKLWKKNNIPPHVIVMTATPIPRTLAMTLYGDLDVSVIDELPPGRKPIATSHHYDSQRLMVFKFLRDRIKEGRQVYIVYPLIEESKKFEYKDLTDGYESIVRAFPAPEYAVSVVHGKMKAEEKEKAMELFANHQTQIMVATTVIEVGVNVPNATVMVIESAEKFGLSQLHQLRGRVGRGADQSYCILMSSYKISTDARKRLDLMCRTNDGFEISEFDLKTRGPGDIDGTRQSGLPIELKIADLAKDGALLQMARNVAFDVLEKDPQLSLPENLCLKNKLAKMHDNTFSKIS